MALQKQIDEVWANGKKVRGKDPNKYRKDDCGNLLYKGSYGKHTPMGWEKDHIKPKSKGGSDKVSNLRPLKTSANRKRGNGKLICDC